MISVSTWFIKSEHPRRWRGVGVSVFPDCFLPLNRLALNEVLGRSQFIEPFEEAIAFDWSGNWVWVSKMFFPFPLSCFFSGGPWRNSRNPRAHSHCLKSPNPDILNKWWMCLPFYIFGQVLSCVFLSTSFIFIWVTFSTQDKSKWRVNWRKACFWKKLKSKIKLILPLSSVCTEKVVTLIIHFVITQAMGIIAIERKHGKWSLRLTLCAFYLLVWNCVLSCE